MQQKTDGTIPQPSYFERVYAVVERIPKGTVMTYGQIAAVLGGVCSARIVGYAMRAAPAERALPCHRVVNRLGEMAPAPAFGEAGRQRRLLEAEGVGFTAKGCVDLPRHRYMFSEYEW